MKKIGVTLYGEKAREIQDALGLVWSGDDIHINADIHVTYKSVEGRPKILMSISLVKKHG